MLEQFWVHLKRQYEARRIVGWESYLVDRRAWSLWPWWCGNVHNCSVLVGVEGNTVESQRHDTMVVVRRWKVKGRHAGSRVRESVLGTYPWAADVTAVEPSRSSHSTPLRKTASTIRTIRTTSREYEYVYSCIGYVFNNTLEAQNAFFESWHALLPSQYDLNWPLEFFSFNIREMYSRLHACPETPA